MSKAIWIFFTIFVLSFFIGLAPVYASHTIDDSVITITQNPLSVTTSSGQVTFTITATRDIFDVNQWYWYNTWNTAGSKDNSCGEYTGALKPTSTKELVITSTLVGCRAELGNWKLEVWLGSTIPDRTPGNMIVTDYNFEITQTGGGNLQIIPVKTPLGLAETPQVNLINGRKDTTYTFWWDGAQTSKALTYTATEDGNANGLNLNKVGADFTASGKKKLCMEVGNYSVPAGLTCRYPAEFDFQVIAPPPPTGGTPDCAIQPPPPRPVKNDSVSIYASNLPLNQEFRADLVSAGITANLPNKENSGGSGIVTLNLSSHIGEGAYVANVYDANDRVVCSESFTVGPVVPGALPAATACTDLKKCAFGGGKSCNTLDNRGPAIETAIGCIHTTPSEFVKDFMRFIIAISGGLAFLMMLLGAFQMLSSQGNPETLNAGRERLTSAIIGLLFIIFAVLLLQIIGVSILCIPGFGTCT